MRAHDSVDEFRATAEPLYRCDPVAHTIELTLLQAGGFPDDSLLLTVWDDDAPRGATLQTPPYPLACNGIPARAMKTVAGELAELRPGLTGVRGMRSSAVAFADAWHTITGRSGTSSTEERLYRLGMLRTPNGVAGIARLATGDDRGQLVEWGELFFRETFSQRDEAAADRFVDTSKRVGDRFVVWDVRRIGQIVEVQQLGCLAQLLVVEAGRLLVEVGRNAHVRHRLGLILIGAGTEQLPEPVADTT